MDERLHLHRLYSTRWAARAAIAALAAWTVLGFVSGSIRWDMLSVLGAMALAKAAGVLWFRMTD